MIHPSPAIIVRADTPIGDCVRQMRDHNVGSVLVVTGDFRGELMGIFTERDLVKKIDEIQHGGYWNQSVNTVMTSPVRSLDVSEMDQAADLMIQHNVRHYPITTTDPDGKKRVVGVISMRDLFRKMVIHEETAKSFENSKLAGKLTTYEFGLVTPDDAFAKLLKKIFMSFLDKSVERIQTAQDRTNKINTIIVDLDSSSAKNWPTLLRNMNGDKSLKLILVAFSPALHPPEVVETLEKLGKSKRFLIFKKPLEVFHFLESLESILKV